MRVLARVEELSTSALRARLQRCEQMLACSGLKRDDRCRLERERRCAERVLASRVTLELSLIAVVTPENVKLGHTWLRRKLKEHMEAHGVST